MSDKDKVIDMILEDIKEIRNDVKELLKFKWQVAGIVSIVSLAISLVVTLILK